MTTEEKKFLDTFREDSELAIKIIDLILSERQREQNNVPSPAA